MTGSHSDLLGLSYSMLDGTDADLRRGLPVAFGGLRQVQRRKGKIVIVTENYVIKSHVAGHPAELLLANEERILRRLQGLAVSELVAAGRVNGRTAIMLRRAPGCDLWAGYVSKTETPKIAQQIRSILSSIESRSVCHNDIRPHNFLWDAASQRLTLIDFEYATETSIAGSQALAQYFLSLTANQSERDYLRSQLADLGGEWKSESGLAISENDRLAGERIIQQLTRRDIYSRLRLKFRWEQLVRAVKGKIS